MIPSTWRRLQGLEAGSELIAIEEDGRLILQTREQAVKDAQEIIRRSVKPGTLLVDALFAERRREAQQEIRKAARIRKPRRRPR